MNKKPLIQAITILVNATSKPNLLTAQAYLKRQAKELKRWLQECGEPLDVLKVLYNTRGASMASFVERCQQRSEMLRLQVVCMSDLPFMPDRELARIWELVSVADQRNGVLAHAFAQFPAGTQVSTIKQWLQNKGQSLTLA